MAPSMKESKLTTGKFNYSFPSKKSTISIVISSKLNLKYINLLDTELNQFFEVAWFLNTSVGLRPIHQNEYLSTGNFDLNDTLSRSLSVNIWTDYVLGVSPETILTEGLIYMKMNQLLNLYSGNETENHQDLNGIFEIDRSSIGTITKGLVSVIVPTYKRDKNLARTISSLVQQTYESVEIIVVDDNGEGSQMSSSVHRIVEEFRDKFPVKYRHPTFERRVYMFFR